MSSSRRSKHSRRSSSNSSSSRSPRYMQWRGPKGTRQTSISRRQVERAESLRFRRRSDLVNFASRHPGALGALFLHHLRSKMSLPGARRMGDLCDADIATWAATKTELKEVWDMRKLQALSRVLMELNRNNLGKAVGAVVMRTREIKLAKSSGGSWEKAELVSLLPTSQPSATLLQASLSLSRAGSRLVSRCERPLGRRLALLMVFVSFSIGSGIWAGRIRVC